MVDVDEWDTPVSQPALMLSVRAAPQNIVRGLAFAGQFQMRLRGRAGRRA